MTRQSRNLIFALAALAAPAFLGSYAWAYNETEVARNLTTFNDLYKELITHYVDSINAEKSITTAINAMLDDVDPYTEYFPAKEQEDFQVVSTGEYGGVGSYITERDGYVYFSEPYQGSPAAKNGVRAGDKIIMIDNDSTKGWSNEKVSAALKGLPNTNVRIVVERPYVKDSIITFNITREKIEINPVAYYGVERGNIGYIMLTTFNEKAAREVKKAVLELLADQRVKGLVLDLRGNGGGLIEQAVQIADFFVPKGVTVVETKGKVPEQNRAYKTTQEPIAPKIPIAVLTDGGTASASEIVAGALQDLDRGVIIGGRSYGKGLVQTTRPLPFDAMLKVTVAKYYIPSGRLIQAIDYSKRASDGSVERIPDSLTHVFTTAHGRQVRDGGGITPDI
ncbi:MAG: S41 family peptidase, partial [Muribaculaceae bacterium]|nr:S41 family peptidase [Muribaculaceae bacterium]